LGLGQRTGVDLPDEASGNLPAIPDEQSTSADRDAVAEVRAAAIGQGTVTATPLQVARLMAAVANGGKLVTPHVVSDWGLTVDPQSNDDSDAQEPASIQAAVSQPIPQLHTSTLETIRRGLVRVVTDPDGSAHPSVYLEGLSIAGKTGTAEAGGGQADHAWFAGYAPAESPRVAFAVALEHRGSGGEAAGPVARRLVQRLSQLGYLGRAAVQRASHQAPGE
jgi:penicillin-binding protein 2